MNRNIILTYGNDSSPTAGLAKGQTGPIDWKVSFRRLQRELFRDCYPSMRARPPKVVFGDCDAITKHTFAAFINPFNRTLFLGFGQLSLSGIAEEAGLGKRHIREGYILGGGFLTTEKTPDDKLIFRFTNHSDDRYFLPASFIGDIWGKELRETAHYLSPLKQLTEINISTQPMNDHSFENFMNRCEIFYPVRPAARQVVNTALKAKR